MKMFALQEILFCHLYDFRPDGNVINYLKPPKALRALSRLTGGAFFPLKKHILRTSTKP